MNRERKRLEIKSGRGQHSSSRVRHIDVDFDVKSTSGDGSTGEGLGSCFFNVDSYGDIVDDGAFLATTPDFLANGFIGGLNHDWDNPIGKPTKAESQANGLLVGWQISDTAHGRDVKTLLKDKVIRKLSIGFATVGSTDLPDLDAVKAYWQTKGYTPSAQDVARAQFGARLLTAVKLYEVSPVTVPANDGCDITGVKFGPEWTERDFEGFLRDAGFSKTQARAVTSAGFKALRWDAGEGNDKSDGGMPGAKSHSSSTATETARLRSQSAAIGSRLRLTGVL